MYPERITLQLIFVVSRSGDQVPITTFKYSYGRGINLVKDACFTFILDTTVVLTHSYSLLWLFFVWKAKSNVTTACKFPWIEIILSFFITIFTILNHIHKCQHHFILYRYKHIQTCKQISSWISEPESNPSLDSDTEKHRKSIDLTSWLYILFRFVTLEHRQKAESRFL